MLSDALLRDLHRLNRADKLRALQVLVSDLAAEELPAEEAWLIPGATYVIATPYDNEAAAQALYAALEAATSTEDDDRASG